MSNGATVQRVAARLVVSRLKRGDTYNAKRAARAAFAILGTVNGRMF